MSHSVGAAGVISHEYLEKIMKDSGIREKQTILSDQISYDNAIDKNPFTKKKVSFALSFRDILFYLSSLCIPGDKIGYNPKGKEAKISVQLGDNRGENRFAIKGIEVDIEKNEIVLMS